MSDEMEAAMGLLAVVRRDRAFTREIVRAFGVVRGPVRRSKARREKSPGARRTAARRRTRIG